MAIRAVSGSNTYVPSVEATGVVIETTRSASKFRINNYVKSLRVDKDNGFYPKINSDEAYRIVSDTDYRWEDGADADLGLYGKIEHEFAPYRTIRRRFPYAVGYKAVAQASWPVMAAHARQEAAKAMTMRTFLTTSILTTAGNWGSNTADAAGTFATSSETNLYIQTTLNTAMLAIEKATGGVVVDEDSLVLVMNPVMARGIATSPEYRNYIKGSPDALSALTDAKNPNRKYGLAPYLYGLPVVVENAVRVSTSKGGAQTRNYIWPNDKLAIVSRPEGLVGSENEASSDFSTIAFRFYEEMTIETKDDPDNRRHLGRIVEDYAIVLQAPETGYLITAA